MVACDLCQRSYGSLEAMRRHRKIHLAGRQFRCDQCHATFARQDVFRRHNQQVHSAKEHEAMDTSRDGAEAVPVNNARLLRAKEHSQQRKRSRMACDQCWKKKERCDVGDPESAKRCDACARQGIECQYSRHSKKIKVTIQNGVLPSTKPAAAIARQDDAPSDYVEDALTSQAAPVCSPTLNQLLHPVASMSHTTAPFNYENDAFESSFDATQPGMRLPSDMALNERTRSPFGTLDPASHSLPSQTLSTQPFSTDLLQSWDWLMDEFIPSSPLLDPHRSTPWRWRSPDITKQKQGLTDSLPGNAVPLGMLEPRHVSSSSLTTGASTITSSSIGMVHPEHAPQMAPDLESLADICIGLDHGSITNNDLDSIDLIKGTVDQNLVSERQDNRTCIYDVVHDCLDPKQVLTPEVLMRRHSSIIASRLALRPRSELANSQEHVLQSYVRLYFRHFHPLWPIFPVPLFGLPQCPPHLYLTLAIIGSQYGNQRDAKFGQMAHQVFRTVLIGRELDMHEAIKSGESLCLTMLLNMATALFFGQRRSFYFAQQLKALLILHAQRIGLFDEARHETQSPRSWQAATTDGTSACYPDVARAEVRRRLAYGILRLDAYIALLMGQRPQINVEDMRISMLGDPAWWQGSLPNMTNTCVSAESDGGLAGSDVMENSTVRSPLSTTATTPSFALGKCGSICNSQLFCTEFRRFYYGVEGCPALRRVVDQELMLFGLVPKVLTLSRQRYSFCPAIGSVTEFDQKRRRDPCFLREPDTPSGQTDEVTDPYAISAPYSSSHQLDYAMAREWGYTLASLARWREVFASTQANAHDLLPQDRQSLFHCHVLYSCVTLHLFADMEELRNLSVLRQHNRHHPLYVRALRWSRSSDAHTALRRVYNTLEIIVEELGHKQGAQFTFLSYVVLYHCAIVLWVSMQLIEAPQCFAKVSTILGKVANDTISSHVYATQETGTQEMVLSTMLRIGDLYHKFNSLWPLVNNFRELVRDLAQRSLL